MGDLGCAPEVRQYRRWAAWGVRQKCARATLAQNEAPRPEAALVLRQNIPTNGPSAPKWTKKQQVRQNPRAPQRITIGAKSPQKSKKGSWSKCARTLSLLRQKWSKKNNNCARTPIVYTTQSDLDDAISVPGGNKTWTESDLDDVSDPGGNKTWTESDLDYAISITGGNVTFTNADLETRSSVNVDVSLNSEPQPSTISHGDIDDLSNVKPRSASTPLKKGRRPYEGRSPLSVLRQSCNCGKKCMRKLSMNDISLCQDEFVSINEPAQRNFIIEQLRRHALISESCFDINLVIYGHTVCKEAWRLVYGVSLSRFNRCVKLVRQGYHSVDHGNTGRSRLTTKSTESIGWMDTFFQTVGDYMPHRNVINLPATWDMKQVYERMIAEFQVSFVYI